MAKLNEGQRAILIDLTDSRRYGRPGDGKGEGWATAVWIAESCDHFFETEWASSRLLTLIKNGLVERGARGLYRITDAGRAALSETEKTEG